MTGRITHPLEADDTLSHVLEAHGTRFKRDFGEEEILKRRGAYLPHWTIENAVYHVRFSLADAMPASVRRDLLKEKETIVAKLQNGSELTGSERGRLIRFYAKKVDSVLDAGHGSCWLADERIAILVSNALEFFNSERYFLYAWAVMPNHVHAVVQPYESWELAKILHSWKSFTANKANDILGRSGAFWSDEYYDRLLRDEARLIDCIEYVYNNPEEAHIKSTWYRFKICYR